MATDTKPDPGGEPAWLDRAAFPFTPRWFEQPDGRMHYVDEGAGPVLLFVHGNPSWSFEYRHLIRHFSATHRCIAIDHLGFGLSDKPPTASYLPQWHAANLARLIEALDLSDVTLVFQDWGGPIGLSVAIDDPGRFRAIVAANSWFCDVRDYAILRWFSRLVGSAFGRVLCERFNFFPKVLLPTSCGDRARISGEVHRHYLAPFPTPATRRGTWVFPRSITGESAWLDGLWRRRDRIAHLPALLLWGMKDAAFAPLLPRWRDAFPTHVTLLLDDIGHNVAEEAGDRLIDSIRRFLANHQP